MGNKEIREGQNREMFKVKMRKNNDHWSKSLNKRDL